MIKNIDHGLYAKNSIEIEKLAKSNDFKLIYQKQEKCLEVLYNLYFEDGNARHQDMIKDIESNLLRFLAFVEKNYLINVNENKEKYSGDLSRLKKCGICKESITSDKYILVCGHIYCRHCLHYYLTKLEIDGNDGIKCPNCAVEKTEIEGQRMIYLVDLAALLDPEELRELYMKKLKVFMARNQDKFIYCPTTDCENILSWKESKKAMEDKEPEEESQIDSNKKNEEEGSTIVFCESCGGDYCFLCKETHYDSNCENARAEIEANNAGLLNLHSCPNCKMKLIKEDGCNQITCFCGVSFCFECNEIIIKDVYQEKIPSQEIGKKAGKHLIEKHKKINLDFKDNPM